MSDEILPPLPYPFFKGALNYALCLMKNLLLRDAVLLTPLSIFGSDSCLDLLRLLMYSGGKSPKGECWVLGKSLLFDAFHFLADVILRSFFM